MKKVFYSLGILGICLLLVGCGCKKMTAKGAVEDFLNQYKSLSSNVMKDLEEVILNEELAKENEDKYRDIMKRQYKDLNYKVIDETYDGDTAKVKVKIKVFTLKKNKS